MRLGPIELGGLHVAAARALTLQELIACYEALYGDASRIPGMEVVPTPDVQGLGQDEHCQN